jgi:UDP-N-acetylmuramate dehydrogenase
MSMDYPQFRKLEGAPNLYAIEGPKHVTEWQPLGTGKWVVHQHYASDYPRYQWVTELLQADEPVCTLTVEGWHRLLNEREVVSEETAPGRIPGAPVQASWKDEAAVGPLTTFGATAHAHCLAEVATDAEVRWALQDRAALPLMVLGGGSNVLMHRDWKGRMLHMNIRGVQKIADDGNAIEVVVGAGDSWHDWVMHALDEGWNGLENLALIPGSVGASPMQNIGAYGVEVKDRFAWLEAIHRETGALERFDAERCAFGYRDSVFKQAEKDKWVIVRVAFRLDRSAPLNTQYGAIQTELESRGWDRGTTHRQVAEAVMAIRQSKLPDPSEVGNAGSFFKNPVVSQAVFERIQSDHPEVAYYPAPGGKVKLAAGWLIDRAGWKGYRRGTCGVHDRQALVLVNYGGATGAEVWALALDIMEDVEAKYGVRLEPEVNQVGL